MQKTALRVSAAIFFIIAVLHLARVIFGVKIVMGDWAVPQGASVAAFIAALLLSLWMFKAAK